jgi:hypothetical protein
VPPTSEPTATPAPAPPGSRAEQLLLVSQLLADLASVPFHFLVFLFTRGRHRKRFQQSMSEARL